MIKRYQITQIHMLVAAFLLPIALLYFISGALYTLDIKGHISKKRIPLTLDQPLSPDFEQLTRLCKTALARKGWTPPSGNPVLREKKNGTYTFYWTDLKRSVTLNFDRHADKAALIYRIRSPLAQIMRVHRAEAGTVFRTMSLILAGGLTIVLLSGFYMGVSIPRFRQQILYMLLAGTGTLCLLVVIHY